MLNNLRKCCFIGVSRRRTSHLYLRRTFSLQKWQPESGFHENFADALKGLLWTCTGGGILYALFVLRKYERVPFTDRRRYLPFTRDQENLMHRQAKHDVMTQVAKYRLSSKHRWSMQAQKILDQLLFDSPDLFPDEWEIMVIDSAEETAASVPGLILVFTGLLRLIEKHQMLGITGDVFAAIIAHELAHAVAKHSIETAYKQQVRIPEGRGGPGNALIAQLSLHLPASREMELEADYISLHILGRSIFNLNSVLEFWSIHSLRQGHVGKFEKLLHSHPTSDDRFLFLKEKIPEVESQYR